jgi:acyl-CoA thioester hydrolase
MLDDYPFRIRIPVAWGEMDSFRHVNNIVYFRYFESVRMVCFEQLGLLGMMERSGIGPILASTSCRFKFPLAYPDTVEVGTRIASLAATEFLMDYRVVSTRHARVAAEGTGLIVVYDYNENARAEVPEELREKILAFGMPD